MKFTYERICASLFLSAIQHGAKVCPFDPAICHFDPALCGIVRNHGPVLCGIAQDLHTNSIQKKVPRYAA
jgi:hypothetical protein